MSRITKTCLLTATAHLVVISQLISGLLQKGLLSSQRE
jgi:hypothetical protein